MKVGIVGGGIAGLTTAWLLDGLHDLLVLEARTRPGGSARDVDVVLDGSPPLRVELGAQHISPELFPHCARLLKELGLGRELVPAPQSFTLSAAGEPRPLLVTPHTRADGWPRETILAGPAAEAFATFVARAVALEQENASWEMTLGDVVESVPAASASHRQLLFATCAAFVGCSNAEAPELSARGATALLARVPPGTPPDAAPLWQNVRGGLARVAVALAAAVGDRTELATGTEVTELRAVAEGFELRDRDGGVHRVDHVVLALPPHGAAELLVPLSGTGDLRHALRGFRYAGVEIGIHASPRFMPSQRAHWSTYNIEVGEDRGDVTIWLGPTHGVDLFKSWIAHREIADDELLAHATFEHLCLTPRAVRARRTLKARQTHDGISFAGHHLLDVESQESAVRSAIDVARRLAPESTRLRTLTDGRDPVS